MKSFCNHEKLIKVLPLITFFHPTLPESEKTPRDSSGQTSLIWAHGPSWNHDSFQVQKCSLPRSTLTLGRVEKSRSGKRSGRDTHSRICVFQQQNSMSNPFTLDKSIERSVRFVQRMVAPKYLDVDKAIPRTLIAHCEGIAFIKIIKAGLFFLAGNMGGGVVIAKVPDVRGDKKAVDVLRYWRWGSLVARRERGN